VEDRAAGPDEKRSRLPIRLADLRRLNGAFWGIVAIGVVFTLARFSEAFLVLKANGEGLPLVLAPLVLVAMNVVYSLGAYPAGVWSDEASPTRLLLWGLVALIFADLALALTPGILGAFAGIALWGAHLALTQGLLAKLVAQSAPPDLRGSAFGLFNLATGVAMLAASAIAGLFWENIGPSATFFGGAGFAVLAAVLLALLGGQQARP
jgi:predicted MFS family arabinose efflux permease